MRNPFIKFALALSALTVLLLLTAATPPDRYPVHVTSTYVFTDGMSNIFYANTPAASSAWSQTFGSSNAVYLLTGHVNTLSNRVNNLEAATNAFGDIITTDIADYATAAQGAKADAAQPGNSTLTNIAALTLTGNAGKVPTVNAGGTAFELQTPSGGGSTLAWSYVKVTNQVTTSSTTFTALTNMVLSITNTSADQSVEVSILANVGGNLSSGVGLRVMRISNGATNECWPNAPTPVNYTSQDIHFNANADTVFGWSKTFIDTPGTNQPTYYVEWRVTGSGIASFNRSANNTASQIFSLRTSSNMILKGL